MFLIDALVGYLFPINAFGGFLFVLFVLGSGLVLFLGLLGGCFVVTSAWVDTHV